MLSSQEKLDEIHSILVKWEKRRKWGIIFSWLYRFVFIGLLLVIIFLPQLFLEQLNNIITPIVTNFTEQMIENQKDKIINLSEKLINNIPGR